MSDIDQTPQDDTRTVENDNVVAAQDPSVPAADDSVRENSIEAPALPDVSVPEASQVGDENTADVRELDITVNTDSVPAQVTGAPAVPVEEVRVHETFVTTDTVITDTSDPRAVQIPDAGRGSLDLPIHQLGTGTVEEVFRSASEKAGSDA